MKIKNILVSQPKPVDISKTHFESIIKKYNVKNIVYYSDSNSGDNGIEVKNMKITTGGIYSNTSMKVRNDGKKST